MPRNNSLTIIVGALTAIILSNTVASAQFCDPAEIQQIIASDGAENDELGYAIDLSGDVAIVGALRDNDLGQSCGAAYIFRFNGTNWYEEAKLVPADLDASDVFGLSVAIDGNLAVIGALGDDDRGRDAGAAYVFRYDGTDWIPEAKLLADDGHSSANFGQSVEVEGNLALVGANWQNGPVDTCGAVYVYEYDGQQWMEKQKLLASVPALWDNFGFSLSLDGDRLLIGAALDWDSDSVEGKAYIFEYDGTAWVEQAILMPHDSERGDGFASSLALDGNHALIGRNWDDTYNYGYGSAYFFRFDGIDWIEEQKIESPNQNKHIGMGYAVALEGSTAVFGTFIDSDQVQWCGGAYVYSLVESEWVQDAVVYPSYQTYGGEFGAAVAIDGNRALVGAHYDNFVADRAGTAYLFDLDCLSILKTLPDPLVAGMSGQFFVSEATPNEPTYLVYSTTGLGETIIPFLNITLDIENPKQAGSTRIADDFGRVQWYLPIPQNALGWNLWLQAAQFENKTRTVTTHVVR